MPVGGLSVGSPRCDRRTVVTPGTAYERKQETSYRIFSEICQHASDLSIQDLPIGQMALLQRGQQAVVWCRDHRSEFAQRFAAAFPDLLKTGPFPKAVSNMVIVTVSPKILARHSKRAVE